MSKPEKRLCCLLCGRNVNWRGWASHRRRKSHKTATTEWWTYNRPLRQALPYFQQRSMEMLKAMMAFSNDKLEPRVGKTVQWYRYSTND